MTEDLGPDETLELARLEALLPSLLLSCTELYKSALWRTDNVLFRKLSEDEATIRKLKARISELRGD